MKKQKKLENVLSRTQAYLKRGRIRYSLHASERMLERRMIVSEVEQVLLSGRRESSKDVYVQAYEKWRYAIRGKTIDGRDLRVIVTFEEEMIVVTVIEVEK